jgi:hypothetical protein
MYQLRTEDFAQNFGVFSLIQKGTTVRTNLFCLDIRVWTYHQVMKVCINFTIGLPATIPSLHFHLTTTDKYSHDSCARDRPYLMQTIMFCCFFFFFKKCEPCATVSFTQTFKLKYGGHAKFTANFPHIEIK